MGNVSGTIIVAGLFVALVLLLISIAKPGNTKGKGDYKQTDIMTDNEIEFFGRLRDGLPEHYIFPQVSLGALLRPNISRNSPDWMKMFNRISSQRSDYAIYNKEMKLIALIELDDKTHNSKKDKERDKRTSSAGIKTLRFESKKKPDAAMIRKLVSEIS